MAIELWAEYVPDEETGDSKSLNLEVEISSGAAAWIVKTGDMMKQKLREEWEALGRPLKGPYASIFNNGTYDNLASGWRWPSPPYPLSWALKYKEAYIPDCLGNIFIINVNDKVRDIIESIEPDVHHFVASELYDRDGKFLERRWLVNVCSRIETIAMGHCKMVDLSYGGLVGPVGPIPYDVAVWKDKIEGRAIWNEYRWRERPLISDLLVQKLKDAGARGWDYEGNTNSAGHIREI